MRPTILGYFFPNNYDGNKFMSFQDLYDPSGVFFIFSIIFYWTYESYVVNIDITMACDISI